MDTLTGFITKIRAIAVGGVFLLAAFFAAAPACHGRSESPPGVSVDQRQRYCNDAQGYTLRIPPELKVNFTRSNDPDWAAANVMPLDYVNFGPAKAGTMGPFELGVGVHPNVRGLSARQFADLKDDGVKQGVRRYVMVRQSNISLGPLKGVRDDFKLEKPSGWWSYSRVIIPQGDKFFVFLGTLGGTEPVAEYEVLFQRVIDSFSPATR